jgi:outer membrane protein assembly factor BamB
VLVALQLLARLVGPLLPAEGRMYAFMAGLALALAVIIWWLGFSRARWYDRIGFLIVMIVALIATKAVVHPSISGGMMGMLPFIYAIPLLTIALVVAAVVTRHSSAGLRRGAIAAGILVVCGSFTLLRTGGMTAMGGSDFHWRWAPTPEDRLLAGAKDKPAPAAAKPAPVAAEQSASWPGFRGPDRDGVVHGVKIATDWAASPPAELWRRPVGPGWSSFAVSDGLIYTQEQRGEEEVVACYRLATGEPVWQHRDPARFWESNAGPGPRATPALSGGRVYTCGATGIINALDAHDGSVIWSRNAAKDTQKKTPGWGFASSPLVVDDLLIVAASGKLAAYELATGKQRWLGPAGGWGYSSPHLLTLNGVAQILLSNGEGAISVAPATGKMLWQHAWPGDGIVQPALASGGEVLIGSGSGIGAGAKVGLRCVSVAHQGEAWTAEERWTTNRLKPYFNDFVVHQGHAFGFDGSGLVCVSLADGERKWKGGRYGAGQVLLVADQDLLLVLSEQGEVALVPAVADQFTEVARFPAIKGKTWNHPVLAGNILLVRNDEEMAAFRVAPKG